MLPIFDILSALSAKIIANDCIVVAPPGAGKSTALPLHLLGQQLFNGKRIIMLQPRRIAARNIAHYLASQLGEKVGERVGYRIRGENKTSSQTQLEIVTEGILTRMLQAEPELEDVGLIIFDEFHERNIHADFSLALCLEIQQALRDDLRLLVMSATLDVGPLEKLLPNADVLNSKGRSYPIDIVHIPRKQQLKLPHQITQVITDIYPKHSQDILVFLPGKYEIQTVEKQLKNAFALGNHSANTVIPEIHVLYSELNSDKQEAALLGAKSGARKIVLATNIAETSLTIEGIEVVVDSGMEKRAVFDLRKRVTQLTTKPISQASATQRAGRAGRLMSGTVYRLWSKELHERLARQSTPAILETALDSFLLEALVWGSKFDELSLIDIPSTAQLAQAEDSLAELELITRKRSAVEDEPPTKAQPTSSAEAKLTVTKLGQKVQNLGFSPNLSVMLLKSAELGLAHQHMACAIAMLLENKDPLGPNASSVDVSSRLRFLQSNPSHALWKPIKQLLNKVKLSAVNQSKHWPLEDTALLLAFANPGWIAKLRSNAKYSLANGSGAQLQEHDPLAHNTWLAIGNMQMINTKTLIRLAEPLAFAQLKEHFSHMFEEKEVVFWDNGKQSIAAQLHIRFGQIVIEKKPLKRPSSSRALEIWKSHIRQLVVNQGLAGLPLSEKARAWLAKVRMLNQVDTTFPNYSEEALKARLDDWLFPYIGDATTWKGLSALPFLQQFKSLLTYPQQQVLDEQVPDTFEIPTGRHVRIDYRDNGKAVVAVRIQEVYGLKQQPLILNNSLAITFELLSPAQRPIQTTDDIVSFFKGSYKEVQKEMKGRYPRHFWPDDPINSLPTVTTKKRMEQRQR